LNDGRIYTFQSALDGVKLLSSKAIADIESYHEINSHPQTALINVPLDVSKPGSMILGTVESTSAHLQKDFDWIDTLMPGGHMAITYIGIRKGAMVSKDAYTTRLALETPYISLPGEIYEILVQATSPTPRQHGGGYNDDVDCGALGRYPDLVLGLEPETEEGEDDEDTEDTEERELVITPKQYILETEEGRCILLAQRAYQRGREEVVLGWAAVRGRDLVLDWISERTGFGR
jgi:saccharopepsin